MAIVHPEDCVRPLSWYSTPCGYDSDEIDSPPSIPNDTSPENPSLSPKCPSMSQKESNPSNLSNHGEQIDNCVSDYRPPLTLLQKTFPEKSISRW